MGIEYKTKLKEKANVNGVNNIFSEIEAAAAKAALTKAVDPKDESVI